ncbi:MAG: T9SS type A sorting domain-containing protein [Bacteroidota bacterium]
MKHFILHLLCIPLLSLSLSAQISYEITHLEQSGNPGGLNQELDYEVSNWNLAMDGGFVSNQWSNSFSLPFTFEFYGQSFTSARVSANGVLTFESNPGSAPGNNGALPSSSLPNNSIAAFWEAFAFSPPILSGDDVLTKTFGTAPNRQFWIKWASYQWGPSTFVYISLVLEEGTNNIYVVDQYGDPTKAGSITSTIGVQKNSSEGVSYGDNIPTSMLGFHYIDNGYYKLEPFLIPPEDLKTLEKTAPGELTCGLGQEQVSFEFKNIGQLPASGYTAKLFVDGVLSAQDVVNSTLAPDQLISHTFTQTVDLSLSKEYDLDIVVTSSGDSNSSNDTIHTTVTNFTEISTFPFQENFETSLHGWTTGGTNSSWEWGTPADGTIMAAPSGVKAWVTNAGGPHNAFENSYVQSPCFDFSNIHQDSWISFMTWWETEEVWDGGSVLYSLDGGDSWNQLAAYSPEFWFNSQFIATLPGGVGQGWSGNTAAGSGANGWRKVYAKLPSAVIGAPQVKFRIAFSSNGTNQYSGMGFDDFTIGRPPVFSLGNDRFFCSGESLSVPANLGTFEWSNGSNTNAVIIEPIGQSTILDSMLILKVTDNLGLERIDTIVFSVAPPVAASVQSISHVDCYGGESGQINLVVEKGTSPYAFDWDGQFSTQNPANLAAGTYSVVVEDANGCTTSLSNIVITQNDSLGLESAITDVKCFGDSTGVVFVEAFGGKAPFSYIWGTGEQVSILDGLPAGIHSVTVMDSLGCMHEESFEVAQPDQLQVAISDTLNTSCPGANNGEVILNIAGGVMPYQTFALHDSLGVFDIDALAPGVYDIKIQDSLGCVAEAGQVEIEDGESNYFAGFIAETGDSSVSITDTSFGGAEIFYDMGDGVGTSNEASFEYTYQENGTYTITQIISSICGSDTTSFEVTINGIQTSIQDAFAQGISIYPNPSKGVVFIKQHDFHEKIDINIFDSAGKVVWQNQSSAILTEISLPSQLSKGLYVVQIQGKSGSQSVKILLE